MRRSTRRATSLVCGALSLLLLVGVAVTHLRSPAPSAPLWGLVGGYAGVDLTDVRRRGVEAVLVEMTWAEAQPGPGALDEAYLAGVATQIQRLRALGFQVALNYGLQDAPAWLLDLPDGRFVDQDGRDYLAEPLPDLVFGTTLRSYAERYTSAVLRRFGPDLFMVRVGGGHYGELGYPGGLSGRPEGNSYWAYSAAAQRGSPVPGYRPCSGSAGPQAASRFLDWYLEALVEFQNWQVSTVRSAFTGQIAVLYPSIGFTGQDRQRAVAADLCGRTPAEQQVAIQRGFDHERQVAALAGSDAVVYCTWVNNPLALEPLARLAERYGVRLAGENGGSNDPAELRHAVQQARRWRLTTLFWIRAEQAYCRCQGFATIDDYQREIT